MTQNANCINLPLSEPPLFRVNGWGDWLRAGWGLFVGQTMRFGQFLFNVGERSRQRRALAKLDDRMLSDIGISRAEVDREISKHFWQD